ncbi:MAG: hypothetical protein ACE5IM_00870, partial [Nitrospinota bacterium]
MAEAKDGRGEIPGGSWIGASVPFQDGVEKAVGTAAYLDDLPVRGALAGCALRSAHAHARVLRVDGEAAARVPGVRAVLTAAHVPGENRLGPHPRDAPAVAGDVVRYRGDVVALVAAESEAAAEAARAAVRVEYDPLPVVSTVEEALA